MELLWTNAKLQWFTHANNNIGSCGYLSLRNISKKKKDKVNIRNYQVCSHIPSYGLGDFGGITILIKNDVPQSKIELKTELLAADVSYSAQTNHHMLSVYPTTWPDRTRQTIRSNKVKPSFS